MQQAWVISDTFSHLKHRSYIRLHAQLISKVAAEVARWLFSYFFICESEDSLRIDAVGIVYTS